MRQVMYCENIPKIKGADTKTFADKITLRGGSLSKLE